MVLDTSLLDTQNYKVRFKGKEEKSGGKEERPSLHIGVVAIEKVAFGSPLITVANFTFFLNNANVFILNKQPLCLIKMLLL